VHDNAIDNTALADVPVRRTRVVMRRWLKIDRTYTDDNGRFASNKHFRNKVNIIVKFKNTALSLRGLRGIRFYQMRFPIKHGIGMYSGNLNNVRFIFQEDTDFRKRAYRNWWAAQTMNAHVEYDEMANSADLQTGTLPDNLKILLTNWGGASGAGSTPMNAHRANAGTPPREWIQFFIVDPVRVGSGAVGALNVLAQGNILKDLDMTLGYNVDNQWTSDRIKALIYHELSHAAHFNKVGAAWWNSLVYSEELTILRWSGAFDPYGNGTDGIASEYISVAESWAEHMARTMCDRQYRMNSENVFKQRNWYSNNTALNLSSHLVAIEDFDPNRPVADDPFRWIPEGIFYDLIDTRNEFLAPITDGVFNFTNRQIFNALDEDIRSMPQYWDRLIGENPNNQTIAVRDLFNQYGY